MYVPFLLLVAVYRVYRSLLLATRGSSSLKDEALKMFTGRPLLACIYSTALPDSRSWGGGKGDGMLGIKGCTFLTETCRSSNQTPEITGVPARQELWEASDGLVGALC